VNSLPHSKMRSQGDTAGRKTQRAAILRLLIDARGDWVPLPDILACAAQYNARIFELRRLGFSIENRTEEIDGVRHSWFRLVNSPVLERPRSEDPKPVAHSTDWYTRTTGKLRPRTADFPLFSQESAR
jgi:hypothetical protein